MAPLGRKNQPAPRRLIVNGDDFGFSPEANRGIVEGHRRGILTATTLMPNGDSFDEALRLSRDLPALDVGCHLNLIGGRSLSPPNRPLPRTVGGLAAAIVSRRIRLYDELRAQIEKILNAGVVPTHLDTHKHTHPLPSVLDAVAKLSQEYRIPWVRRPLDVPLTASPGLRWLGRAVGPPLRRLRARAEAKLRRHGCRITDHFAGFALTSPSRTRELVALLHALPDGITEFVCHPARRTEATPHAARRFAARLGERELRALTAPEVRAAADRLNIVLTNFRELH